MKIRRLLAAFFKQNKKPKSDGNSHRIRELVSKEREFISGGGGNRRGGFAVGGFNTTS